MGKERMRILRKVENTFQWVILSGQTGGIGKGVWWTLFDQCSGFETNSIMVVTATQENLVELRVVEEVGPVSVNQGAESQAVLPATSANQQREPTCQMSSLHSTYKG